MEADNRRHSGLQELGDSDFEIASGHPDIRGWDVTDSTGRKVGKVEELLVDAGLRKIRYMVVTPDRGGLDRDEGRGILIPIGLAELDGAADEVIIPAISPDQFRVLPAYNKNQLTPEVESQVCHVWQGKDLSAATTASTGEGGDFYSQQPFNEESLYRRRAPAPASGMQFKDGANASGSEVWGYTGRASGENPGTADYQSETPGEGEAVPVNRSSLDDEEELRVMSQRDVSSEELGGLGRERNNLPDNDKEV